MTMSDIHTKNSDINVSPEKMEEIKIEISSYLENLSNSTLKHLDEKKQEENEKKNSEKKGTL